MKNLEKVVFKTNEKRLLFNVINITDENTTKPTAKTLTTASLPTNFYIFFIP